MTDATENARRDRSALEQHSRRQREDLERELSDARREISSLRAKLEHYLDYDEVKRELEILKVSRRPNFLRNKSSKTAKSARSSSSSQAETM